MNTGKLSFMYVYNSCVCVYIYICRECMYVMYVCLHVSMYACMRVCMYSVCNEMS